MITFAEFLRLKNEALTLGMPQQVTAITAQMIPPQLKQYTDQLLPLAQQILQKGISDPASGFPKQPQAAISAAWGQLQGQMNQQKQPQDMWSKYDASARGMPSAKGY